MPTPSELRARARQLLELADEMERLEHQAQALTGALGDRTMDSMDTQVEGKIRRGVPLTSTGPYSVAARNSGHSLYELAQILGLKYSTIKMRNARRDAPEADRKVLAKKPYNVPASAWKK